MSVRVARVLTHRRPDAVREGLQALVSAAREAGVTLRLDEEEFAKHDLQPDACLHAVSTNDADVDLCIAMGGDGTILTGLRSYAGTGVPVYGVNYGQVGFLATRDPDGLRDAFTGAFSRDFDVLELPAIEIPSLGALAFNDVSVHRKAGMRVADLAYSIGPDEIGRVRCDGLVVATPAGSTGYNLANGGPVLAWGVEGYVVSFIAPHSLAARPLVVAPDDELILRNASHDPVDVMTDGRPTCTIDAGEELRVQFRRGAGILAQMPGASFYHRFSERFGRLAQ